VGWGSSVARHVELVQREDAHAERVRLALELLADARAHRLAVLRARAPCSGAGRPPERSRTPRSRGAVPPALRSRRRAGQRPCNVSNAFLSWLGRAGALARVPARWPSQDRNALETWTRRVRLVREEGRDVSSQYGREGALARVPARWVRGCGARAGRACSMAAAAAARGGGSTETTARRTRMRPCSGSGGGGGGGGSSSSSSSSSSSG
jgi:hypothetical protein